VEVGGRVDPVDLDAGLGDESFATLRPSFEGGLEALAPPSVGVLAPALVIGHGCQCGGKTDAVASGAARRMVR